MKNFLVECFGLREAVLHSEFIQAYKWYDKVAKKWYVHAAYDSNVLKGSIVSGGSFDWEREGEGDGLKHLVVSSGELPEIRIGGIPVTARKVQNVTTFMKEAQKCFCARSKELKICRVEGCDKEVVNTVEIDYSAEADGGELKQYLKSGFTCGRLEHIEEMIGKMQDGLKDKKGFVLNSTEIYPAPKHLVEADTNW